MLDPKQLKMGIKVESEHKDTVGNNKEMFKKIAMDHLREFPDYYSRLKKMEAEAKKEPKSAKKRKIIQKTIEKLK